MATILNWHRTDAGILIPAGIIMPFDDVAANIPSGWTQFTAPANRAFQGHTTTAGSTGGSTGVARTTPTGGSHIGLQRTYWGDNAAGSVGDRHTDSYAGDHTHSLTVNFSPARLYQVMMKADADYKKFPAKTGFLTDTDIMSPLGCSDITTTGYLLCGASGSSTTSAGASSSVSGVNSTGGHSHISGLGGSPTSDPTYKYGYGRGDSSHSGSASVTDNIYRYYMAMWSHASAELKAIPGIYGLWESSTPPDGWAICDGNNGTPNLSGRHIGLDRSNQGTTSGNGTITTSGSLASNGSHNHDNGTITNPDAYGRHYNNVSHDHTFGASASGFSPQYYTIIFIKCTG